MMMCGFFMLTNAQAPGSAYHSTNFRFASSKISNHALILTSRGFSFGLINDGDEVIQIYNRNIDCRSPGGLWLYHIKSTNRKWFAPAIRNETRSDHQKS